MATGRVGRLTFGQEFGQKEKPSKLDNGVRRTPNPERRLPMDKFTHLSEFLAYLFDDEGSIQKAQAITTGIGKAHSCRVSEIARKMPEEEVGKVKLGSQAKVYVDSAPGKPFPGKVVQINDEAEFTPKNIQTTLKRPIAGTPA